MFTVFRGLFEALLTLWLMSLSSSSVLRIQTPTCAVHGATDMVPSAFGKEFAYENLPFESEMIRTAVRAHQVSPDVAEQEFARDNVATSMPAEAEAYLQSRFFIEYCELSSSVTPFRFEAGYSGDRSLSVEHLKCLGRGRIRLNTADSLTAVSVLRGSATVVAGDEDDVLDDRQALLVGSNCSLEIEWSDLVAILVRLDPAWMQRVAALFPDRSLDPAVTITHPVGAAQTTHLEATIDYVRRAVFAPSAIAQSPFVRRSATDLVAAAVLNTFGSVVDRPTSRTDLEGVPPTVLRACLFFDAEARSPIAVPDAARATGASVRTLQASFQRHLGLTPSQYLTSVRLAGAHRELAAEDPASTVTVDQVRRTWHFSNAGRFARLYRDAFGELPRETLGR